jgi:hypothetical protein
VFISYAHDSDAHREQVRNLWIFLRAHGVDARIDRVGAEQRRNWPLWMERQVAKADRILILASPAYKARAGYDADAEVGRGVQYEARLIRDLFYRNPADLDRFLPVVLPGGNIDDLPAFLTPATSTAYRISEFTVAGAEALLRVIHQRPGEVQPVIGAVPKLPTRDHTLTASATGSGGSSTPPPAASVLHHRVDVAGGLTGLPRRATSFVGRQDDVRRVVAALGTAALVTLTGMGGWASPGSPSRARTGSGRGMPTARGCVSWRRWRTRAR